MRDHHWMRFLASRLYRSMRRDVRKDAVIKHRLASAEMVDEYLFEKDQKDGCES